LQRVLNSRLEKLHKSINNLDLKYAISQFIKKNKLSLFAKFMDTKYEVIKEITRVIETLPRPGHYIVGGLHNLHISPIMHNDYRKRKLRKSRKLNKSRKSRKLNKSRKSRKLKKSRKLRI